MYTSAIFVPAASGFGYLVTPITLPMDEHGEGQAQVTGFEGQLLAIRYVASAEKPYGATTHITAGISGGEIFWEEFTVTASKLIQPRRQICEADGTPATYDGTHPVVEPYLLGVGLSRSQINIVVLMAENYSVGTFLVYTKR